MKSMIFTGKETSQFNMTLVMCNMELNWTNKPARQS